VLWHRFEWPVARSDLASHEIELNVKNDKGIFSTGRVHMGQLRLDLSQFDDLTKASTEWYDIFAKRNSFHSLSSFMLCDELFFICHNLSETFYRVWALRR